MTDPLSRRETPPSLSPPVTSDAKASKGKRFLGSRRAVLLTLFCVTGFLGLPLLWTSPAFSRVAKIGWSAAVTAYTSVLLWLTGTIVAWSYRNVSSALGW